MKYEITKGSEKDFEGAPEWATECVWNDKAGEYFSYWVNPKENKVLAPRMNGSPAVWSGIYGHHDYIKAERRPITEPELKPIYGDGIHDDSEALQQRIDMGIDINNIIGEQGKLFNISKPLQFGVVKDSVVSQQLTTEWGGEGLPPVGCHCEVKTGKDSWNLCKIVFSDDAAGVAFVYLGGDDENYVGSVDCIGAACAPSYFRVMRSPEDVARGEAIHALNHSLPAIAYDDILEIYKVISEGKIPGIKLEN